VKFPAKKFWHCFSEMISYRAQFGDIVVGPAGESFVNHETLASVSLTIAKFAISRDDSLQANQTFPHLKALRQRNNLERCLKCESSSVITINKDSTYCC
jgi:hypothetical protein